ncbi:hypothetical protein KC319_g9058 [Hortaea werneckii]|nr:hypothetical protein KC319_g9058 [Hortaea werneckii]
MADYELSNTAEWDLEYAPATKSDVVDGSQEVVNKKRASKPEHKPAPPLSQAAQQSSRRKSRQQYGTGRQRQPPISEPGALLDEWQNEGTVQPARQQLRPLKFPISDDGEAEAAWRAHAKPAGEVRIPESLVFSARQHETIARRCGTFVFNRNEESIGGEKIYDIWGEQKAVERTAEEISAWVNKTATSDSRRGAAQKFAKVSSQEPLKRQQSEEKWRREVRKQTYRQDPPPNKRFQAIGSFHWPVDECRPDEVLGSSYEALDPIRMNCSCHITFHAGLGVFRIFGTTSEVKAGLQRLLLTCFQIAARQVLPVRKYLLRWPQETVPAYLYLEQYDHPVSLTNDSMPLTKYGRSPRGEYLDEDARPVRAAMETAVNTRRVRNMIISMLGKLHYFRGSIQMRIRLGTLLLKQYKPPTDDLYDLDEYERMANESQFQAEVTQEQRDSGNATPLLDINLTDLNSGRAWQFDILASQPVDERKVPNTLQNFAKSVRVDAVPAARLKTKDPFVLRYNALSNLISVQERTCYSYVIANSEFNLEISRFQNRTYHARPSMAAPKNAAPTSSRAAPDTSEPRWSLSVYCEAWGKLFNENERLPVGQGVEWKGEMAKWFPADIGSEASEKEDKGWSQLMDNLGQIEAMIAKLKAETDEEDEDLLGGVQIA